MPQPFLVGDERAFADFLQNQNAMNVQAVSLAGLQFSTVAASAAINTVETIISPVVNLIPGTPGSLKVGSKIRFIAEGSCTASAANVSTFTIRAGTLGTVADASVAAFATPVSATGTSVFRATIEFVVRTLGATGTGAGSLELVQASATVGILGQQATVVAATTATLATTTATFIELTYVAAAATTTCTFQDVSVEIFA